VKHDPGDSSTSTGNRVLYRSLRELAEQNRVGVTLPNGPSGTLTGELFLKEDGADALSRRRFLNLLSTSAALALGTVSCSRIDRGKVVPYTKKPEEIIPGVATYYASTFQEGLATYGVLVKTREGRPIHVEGNPEDPLSGGKLSLRTVADVLGLYDPDRLKSPSLDGTPSTWSKADEEITRSLRKARSDGKPVLLLTGAVVSPTQKSLIEDLKKALPALRHVAWEPAASQSEILAAHALYGEALIPRTRFDRAEVILSLQADFLGADASAPAMIRGFAGRRAIASPSDTMSRLWVVEGCMSLTGANADQRLQVRPSQIAALAFALARFLNQELGVPFPPGISAGNFQSRDLDAEAKGLGLEVETLRGLAADLKQAGRSAMVLAGPALPLEAHVACQLLNSMLEAEGHTLDTAVAPHAPELLTFDGLREILRQAGQGEFAVAVFWDANPAYAFPQPEEWKNAVAGIPLKIRIGLYEDETALACRWRLPEHHWLEAWGDFEPATDLLTLRQPTMGAIHDTRPAEEILLSWLRGLGAQAPQTYLEYLKSRWQKEVYPPGSPVAFDDFWNGALHDGVLSREASPRPARVPRTEAFVEAMKKTAAAGQADDFEVVLLPGSGVYDGRYANNGWLEELPDPVTKATWGNPVLLSIADAERLAVKDEDLVRVTAGAQGVDVPVIIQPGETPGVATLALGYGRLMGGVANGVGANAYHLMDAGSSSPHLRTEVRIARSAGRRMVPRTQEHSRMHGRDPARSWTLAEYSRMVEDHEMVPAEEPVSLIPARKFPDHKWGMAIDLSACVGCSACLIACQSENNIAVVGPQRVAKSREMHWIRIDRYYEGDPRDPKVIHQPVPCQHCDDAPCEVVCPVNATTHSPDGLNQMAYNRCVGTRYCSNNCPYKVRRFNFFDYTSFIKDPGRLVFNPEVTVRPRGVMEKCSFCVQRIENARQIANVEGRPVRDGEIVPACAVACPAEAIVFGDLNDPQSRVSKMAKVDRGYRMLTELGVKPSVTYLASISNPVTEKGKA
jgi:Fe-S-cluster-containing dehydrogenase component/anaerobic selenocysteine-containing dehydrogenase